MSATLAAGKGAMMRIAFAGKACPELVEAGCPEPVDGFCADAVVASRPASVIKLAINLVNNGFKLFVQVFRVTASFRDSSVLALAAAFLKAGERFIEHQGRTIAVRDVLTHHEWRYCDCIRPWAGSRQSLRDTRHRNTKAQKDSNSSDRNRCSSQAAVVVAAVRGNSFRSRSQTAPAEDTAAPEAHAPDSRLCP